MKNATKATVAAMSAIVALAGLEHGIGEILQGNITPDGLMIMSWPGPAFSILAGEPAMTIVPNLLVTGILAVFFSLIFFIWTTMFVQRKNGGLVLILLSILLLLVGGGLGPPVLGIILGVAGTKINSTWMWWRAHLPIQLRRSLGKPWPWFLVGSIIAWLMMFPGLILIDHFFGVRDPHLLISIVFFAALGSLLLAIFSGFARDSLRQAS
jgi:MFS family permease